MAWTRELAVRFPRHGDPDLDIVEQGFEDRAKSRKAGGKYDHIDFEAMDGCRRE